MSMDGLGEAASAAPGASAAASSVSAAQDASGAGPDAAAISGDAASPKVARPDAVSGAKSDAAPGAEQAKEGEKLGEGGTSMVSGPKSERPGMLDVGGALGGESRRSEGREAAKIAGAGAGTAAASQALTFFALLNWLRTLFAAAVAAGQNFLSMAFGFVMGVANSVAGFFVTVGSWVAGAFGISAIAASIATGIVAVVTTLALVLGLGVAAAGSGAAQASPALADCTSSAQVQAAVSTGDATGAGQAQIANAQTVFSILKAWGMPNDNIAGILGNWQAESGLDPTSVQNFSGSAYQMTTDKQLAAGDTNNGIGLGQWTFGRNAAMRAFAGATGQNWWTVQAQMGYLVSPAEGANADIIKGMITTDQGSPSQAALYFNDKWERSADTPAMAQRRATYAQNWFGLMSGWSANASLAGTVLGQAGTTLGAANSNEASVAKASCQGMDAANVALANGGMTQAQAQALVDLYNQTGNAFLDARYGQYGGPGSCGDNHAENCVSFSVYFLNKYTSFQQYPPGNGIDTARSLSKMSGLPLTSTPAAYSIGSGPGSGSDGHTLVVLGVNGDQVIVGEAAYCQFMGRVRVASAKQMAAEGWVFVNVSSIMLPAGQVKNS